MSLRGKVKGSVEIMSPANEFFELYNCRPYEFSKYCPETCESVSLDAGQWGKEGSITCWNFLVDGKTEKVKVITEKVDYKNKSIGYKTIEGNVKELYKTFKSVFQVIPREEGSLLQWTLEYEKLNQNVPDPKPMLQIVLEFGKNIDANFSQANTRVLQCN